MEPLTRMTFRAVQVGRRIQLRRFPGTAVLASAPPIFAHTTEQGYIALFRYGVVVFIDIPLEAQQRFITETLEPYVEGSAYSGEEETVEICLSPNQEEGVVNDRLLLHDAALPRLQLVAEVLARSVLLASYESRIQKTFEQIDPLAEQLALGKSPRSGVRLLRTIGSALSTEHDMVGRAQVAEKPELLWEHTELERLFRLLEDEFELGERDAVLARKIDLVSRTAQTALELLQSRRSHRVEWYIVALIAVEIGLTLFELFFQH